MSKSNVKPFKVCLPTFFRSAMDVTYYLQIAGICVIDENHRKQISKLATELDLEFKSISEDFTKERENGEGSKS